ncbi:ThiF family adenylyltransferase [Olsenella sp. KGMB02461]|nr:ThiF family adenylyltransferase [Olsenella sp. KGMB02461]
MMLSSDARRQINKALVPEAVFEDGYAGELRASFHASSGILNIYPCDVPIAEEGLLRGCCDFPDRNLEDGTDYDFRIVLDEECKRSVLFRGEKYEVQPYDLVQNVFSRNGGLIESEIMADKAVAIFGCGSVGSLIALALARVGVGNFLLVDNDVLEYHNICRHQCGIHEVGEYKVDAVKARILDINPTAHVEVCATLAEYAPKALWDRWVGEKRALCVGCADNREADVYVNGLCLYYSSPFVSIGFWERAFAGEIFYWLPDSQMTCYKCALGDGSLTSRNSARRRLYTTQEKLKDVHFEPGIAVDIDFVTNIGAKVAIDILNIGNDRFTQRLLPELQQYTLVCNTNNPAIGGKMAEIFSYPLQVTTSLKVTPLPGCDCCKEDGRHE